MSATHPIEVDSLLNGSVESKCLEFKACWDQYTTGPEVLRKIYEFANDYDNLNGGYVVIGVEQRCGQAVRPPSGLSAEEVEAAGCWIRNKCRQFEPPYRPKLFRQTVDERFILVIYAPVSDDKPHCGPYGSTEGDQQRALDRVVGESGAIRAQVRDDDWDEAERMLEDFEKKNRESLSPQGATNANSHVMNMLVHDALKAGDKRRAERLLQDKHFAPSGYDAVDAAILAYRVRDALARNFCELAGSRALLVFAQFKIRLAQEAHSHGNAHERQQSLAHARRLLQEADELDLSATQRARAKRLAGDLDDLGGNTTPELGRAGLER